MRVITGTGVPVGDVSGVDCHLGVRTQRLELVPPPGESGTFGSCWRSPKAGFSLPSTFVSGFLHPLSKDLVLAW